MNIALIDKNVKLIGRTRLFNETLLLSLSGSGIEFEYRGQGMTVSLIGGEAARTPNNEENHARVAIYVDGARKADFLLNKCKFTVRFQESPTDNAHSSNAYDVTIPIEDSSQKSSVIRIIKLSECAMSLVGIRPIELEEGGCIKPTLVRPIKLEFIGDSITCGYGVDDPDPLHNFKTGTEDVTKAFAYKTASALDADYSMFSTSGYGIISGYTDDPAIRHADQLIPTFYESMGLSYDKLPGIPKSQDIGWDFSNYIPDITVLNLGTNDDSYCQDDEERQKEFARNYIQFLKTIRKRNSKAYIVCAFGLMGDRLYPTICNAVNTYKEETGDTRIATVHLPEQDEKIGYAANYHPLESEHQKAADILIPFLNKIISDYM